MAEENVIATINLPRDTTLQAIAGQWAIANSLKKLELKKAGIDVTATDWESFRAMVRGGTLLGAYDIGDQFKTTRGDDTLIWDLVHYGKDEAGNYAVLQTHETYKTAMQFDGREALFYAAADLPAGTYHFTMDRVGWTKYTGSFQFTTTKVVPKGGQLCFDTGAGSDTLPKQIISYANQTTTTALETVALTMGTTGTDLATIGTLNHIQRVVYGSNNYKESAIRQWLNSDKAAGSVWTPQTNYDRPPTWSATEAGFMNGLEAEFIAVVANSTQRTALNTTTDGGGYVDTTDKFFLAARSQLNYNIENGVDEGGTWEYYTRFRADSGTGRNDGDDQNRIKYYNGSVRHQWLRSPYYSSACSGRIVYTGGRVSSAAAQNTCSVAPACIIR